MQKEPKAEEGDYGDSFTNVGLPLTFYPKRETRITLSGKPFIDGRLHYPVETKRVFELGRSTLTVMATDLQLNLRDRHVLDYIVIKVEIGNRQEDQKQN